jgi:hypothetical protein
VKESNPLSFSAEPRNLIDQLDSSCPAPLEHRIEVVDRKADVMDTGPASRKELSNRRFGTIRLQQLDEAFPGRDGRYPRAIGIGDLHLRHLEDIAEKRELRIDRRECDSNMGDAGAFRGFFLH